MREAYLCKECDIYFDKLESLVKVHKTADLNDEVCYFICESCLIIHNDLRRKKPIPPTDYGRK